MQDAVLLYQWMVQKYAFALCRREGRRGDMRVTIPSPCVLAAVSICLPGGIVGEMARERNREQASGGLQ